MNINLTNPKRMNNGKYIKFTNTLLFIFLLIFMQNVYSQDSVPAKRDRKNTVKFNLTNPMFFGSNNYIIGYERTIGNHQSFSVHVGTFSLGRLVSFNTDSITNLNKNIKSVGLSLSGDYRFYLAKENKYKSPHGIYIGPYFAVNNFNRTFEFSANTSAFTGQLNADFNFNVTTFGFQLGYQFIFWDRVSLDMILFGPGASVYKLKTNLSTTLAPDQESELFKRINEILGEKIPGYSQVIKPGSFERSGSVNTTGMGYRYIVMVGFRF